MSEESTSSGKVKWSKVLAILFAALFAIFWSLGAFFFWSLLGCCVYFSFLSIYSSAITFNFFERDQNSTDPHRPYQRPSGSGGQTSANPAVRILRIIVFFVIGFFMFL